MRFVFLVLSLSVLVLSATAQKKELFSRAKINLDNQHTIAGISALGLAVDHGEHKKNTFFISDFSQSEIDLARKAGFKIDILIPDVSKHYRDQNSQTAAKTTAAGCHVPPIATTPSHFHLGSYAGYFTYTEMLDILDSMRLLYPSLISAKQPVGTYQTIEGRPIYWVRISNNPTVDQPLKPQMLTTSVHHAREPGSLSANIFYLWYLLENYATDPHIKAIVDNTELYFIPCLNPDGYIRNITTDPAGGGLWRKNMRDNLDGTFGVDLNRNYGLTWGFDDFGSSPVTSSQTYRGTAAFSEPETQAMKWFAENHNFKLNLNYHTYNNALIYPWGHVYSLLTEDSTTFSSYGAFITAENNYRYGTCDQTLSYVSNGGSDDWMYGDTVAKDKIFAFTPEVGSDEFGFYTPASNIEQDCINNLAANVNTASLLLPYARITNMEDKILVATSGYLNYNLQRLGIPDTATYTVSIQALDSWLTVPATTKTYSSLAHLQQVADSFAYTIAAATPNGQEIKYVLKVNNGLYDYTDTVSFFYGKQYNITTPGTNTLADWVNDGWNACTASYVSAPAALKSSASCSNYLDDGIFSITLRNPIDLTYATEAWLRFFARWGIESKYDYVSVQASVEGSGLWTPLCGNFTKPGTIYQLYNEPVYDAQQPYWLKEDMNLADYLGEKILLKFEMVSDEANNYEGFWVDDIEVRSVQDSTVSVIDQSGGTAYALHTYPNPVGNSLYVSTNVPVGTVPMVGSIYDLMGRKVLTFGMNKSTTTVDVTMLPSGMYNLRLMNGNVALPVKKVVISR